MENRLAVSKPHWMKCTFELKNWQLDIFASVQAFLKGVLSDLCLYNKRGANQGTYLEAQT